MRLSSGVWKTNYASDEDDLVRDFYLPALELSDTYDRAVGFFSSHALSLISPGLDSFVARGGKMQVLASPKNLSDEDLQAIVGGEASRDLLEQALTADLSDAVTPSQMDNWLFGPEVGVTDSR